LRVWGCNIFPRYDANDTILKKSYGICIFSLALSTTFSEKIIKLRKLWHHIQWVLHADGQA
jgi:hypothetical protein